MLKNREELISYRELAKAAYAMQEKKIIVYAGTGCVAGGSLDIYKRLNEIMTEKGLNVAVELMKDPHSPSIGLKKSGCHGFCEMGPLVRIEPEGWLYTKVKVDDCEEIVEKTIVGGECVDILAYKKNGETLTYMPYDIEGVEPVYTELKGWETDLTGLKSEEELPEAFKDYIKFLETELGVPVKYLSIGPDRDQTITRSI